MQAGFKRTASIFFALIGALSIVLHVVSSWAMQHTTDTNTYVATTAIVIDQPQVQSKIAQTIVNSVVGEAQVPEEILSLLASGARVIVASDGFHTFWEFANTTMHEIVRNQLLGNTAIDPDGARIDITPEVNLILDNLRALDPRLSQLLPDSAPKTPIQIVNSNTLVDIRNAINGLERLRSYSLFIAVAMFAISTLMLGLRRRSLVMTSLALWATAPAIYGVSKAIPLIAQRFIDEEFRESTYIVATHMASTMTTSVWQVVFCGLVVTVIAFFPRKNVTRTQV